MKHDCNCHQHHVVLFGTKPDQTDGLVWIVMKNNEALFGTTENPGGTVRAAREQERAKWIKAGMMAVLSPIGGFLGALAFKWLTTK